MRLFVGSVLSPGCLHRTAHSRNRVSENGFQSELERGSLERISLTDIAAEQIEPGLANEFGEARLCHGVTDYGRRHASLHRFPVITHQGANPWLPGDPIAEARNRAAEVASQDGSENTFAGLLISSKSNVPPSLSTRRNSRK